MSRAGGERPAVLAARSLYELGDSLGRGSMGVVYRAINRVNGATVALKRVRPEGGRQGASPTSATVSADRVDSTSLRLALAREFRTLATLRHPNIISVYDFGFDESGEPFFTMELLDKPQSLLVAVRDLPWSARVDLLLQVLSALSYLHRHALVHRDLKPSNIAVARGKAKVLDFGIVTGLLGQAPSVFGADVLVGTLRYMAPEVLAGGRADAASDLFSFGIVAYQCLVGRHPFFAITDDALVWKIRNAEPDLSPFGLVPTRPAAEGAEDEIPTVIQARDESLSSGIRPSPSGFPPPDEADDEVPPDRGSADVIVPTAEDLAGIDPEVRLAVGEVLRALLAKDPAARPADADQASEMLSAATRRTIFMPPEIRARFATAARFVGRRAELEILSDRVEQAAIGKGSSCLIGGESGVGKSRLVDEVRTLALVEGIAVLFGQATAETSPAYDVWVDVFRWLGMTLRDPALLSVIGPYVPDLEQTVGVPIQPAAPLAPSAALRRLWAAVEGALHKIDVPTLLVLEDLHWAGSESLSLLHYLSSRIADLPLLLLGTYRDDENPDLAAQLPAMTPMTLGRLSFGEVRELSEAMLGHAGASFPFVESLYRETEGNVFLATEVARSLPPVASSEPIEPLVGMSVSKLESVSRIVERRTDKLGPTDRRLLLKAAVVGREPDLSLLRRIEPAQDLEEWAGTCVRCGLFEPKGSWYRFRHDKFREAILGGIPAAERAALHREVAGAAEEEHRNDRKWAGRIAHHLTACGEGARALPYLQNAATDAIARYANKEAVRWLETAIQILDDEPPANPSAPLRVAGVLRGDRDRLLFSLHRSLAPALIATRGYAAREVTAAYERAKALGGRLGLGASDVFPILFGLWLYELVRGDIHASAVAADGCRAGLGPTDELDLAVEAYRAVGATTYYLGRFRDADENLRRSIACHDPERHADHGFRFGGDPGVVSRLYLALTDCFRGKIGEARILADEALATAALVRHPFTEAYAHGFRAWIAQLLGNIEATERSADKAIALSEEHGFPFWLGFGTMMKGWSTVQREGSREGAREGERLMRDGLEILRGTGAGLWESYWRLLLADAALLRGADGEALSGVEAGIAHATATGESFAVPLLEILRGRILANTKADGEARAVLASAREAALDRDDRLSALRASLELVRLGPATGGASAPAGLLASDLAAFDAGDATAAILDEARR